MNRTSYKVAASIAGVALLAGMASFTQARRLTALRGEIDQWRMKTAGQEAAAEHAGRERDREPRAEHGPVDVDGLSLAGVEGVPEALRLVEMQAPGWRANPDEYWASRAQWPDSLEPLADLMLQMGAGAAKKLLGDPALDEMERKALVEIFSRLSPPQGVLLSIQKSAVEPQFNLVGCFRLWVSADPAAAVHWQREMEAKGDPAAAIIAGDVMVAEGAVDPVRAVAKMTDLVEADKLGGEWVLCTVGEAKGVDGRIEMMNALNRVEERFKQARRGKEMWAAAIESMNGQVMSQPFDDAMAVMDACYTPEEKLALVKQATYYGGINEREFGRWGVWMAGLDFPVDGGHPLIQLLHHSPPGEPLWLDDVPKGELRDLAIADYAIGASQGNRLDITERWLAKLPAGAKKKEVVENIADTLEWAKSPAVAEAFRKSEGVEK